MLKYSEALICCLFVPVIVMVKIILDYGLDVHYILLGLLYAFSVILFMLAAAVLHPLLKKVGIVIFDESDE